MISFPAHVDIFVCHKGVSFGCGIDGMIRYCRVILQKDPVSQAYFLFISKRKNQIRALWFDGQGFSLCTKRTSVGSFLNWPKSSDDVLSIFSGFDAQVLFLGGDINSAKIKKEWKKIGA